MISQEKKKTILTCLICGAERNRMARHVRSAHGIEHRDYLIKYVYGGVPPLCGCGCGEEAQYNMIHHSEFKSYLPGHRKEFLKKNPGLVKRMVGPWLKASQSTAANEKRSVTMRLHHEKHPEHGRAISSALSGRELSGATREKISRTRSMKIASGEIVINNEEISRTISSMYVDGTLGWEKGSCLARKCKKKETINYRSSFEKAFVDLIERDDSVAEFDFEWTVVQYTTVDGVQRRYVPDFLVTMTDGREFFVEVKPVQMRALGNNPQKRDAAQDVCDKNSWTYSEWEPGEPVPWSR